LRVLATMGERHASFFLGARRLRGQGYDMISPSSFAVMGPVGMPAKIVAALSAATRSATASEELRRRLPDVALTPGHLDQAETAARWAAMQARQRPLIKLARPP
jgi:tripartite-type tricarboxylate transporter receptor subunit TctC